MRHFLGSLILALALAGGSAAANAYDNAAFESDVAAAYSSFHAAASYLRTDNASIGGLELADAQAKWRAIAAKAAATPPPAYAGDGAFVADINKVVAILGEGLDMADQGETRKAYDHLLTVRDVLYGLRGRAGTRNYADCVTELNKIMLAIIPMRRTPPDLGSADGKAEAGGLFADYGAKLKECEGMAPAGYHDNAEFQRLYQLTTVSAQQSLEAVNRGNDGELFRMLGEIISFDRIIFFRFGG